MDSKNNVIYENQEFYDSYLSIGFEQLHKKSQHFNSIYKTFDTNLKRFLPITKNSRILDIGCGMGELLKYLKLNGYENYLGVDIGMEQIIYCKKEITDKVLLISNLESFLQKNSQSFEVIIMLDVLDHITKHSVVNILKLISSALTTDGILIAKVENMSSLTGFQFRYHDFTHEIGYTEISLFQLLNLTGFTQIAFFPWKYPLKNLSRILRLILQKWVNLLWKIVLFLQFVFIPKVVTPSLLFIARPKKT